MARRKDRIQNESVESIAPPAGGAAARRYTAACAALGAAAAAGLAACALLHGTWAVGLLFPLLGAVLTALLWCVFVRLCLCRGPARLLARDFVRALRRALGIPLWAGVTALLCLPEAEMPETVAVLLFTLFLAAVPASAAAGVMAVCSAVRHLRAAPARGSALYREGPLVLAALLLTAELSALGWLAFYFLF